MARRVAPSSQRRGRDTARCYTARLVTPLIIAIDGPSGSGKGTLARRLADALGYRHVDTGAMYRAVAWRAHQLGYALDDESAVAALASRAELSQDDGRVVIDGHDVTRAIRTPDIDQSAARVARLPEVRKVLVARQRELGAGGGVVMEGRYIGTVVFPGAEVKVYPGAPEYLQDLASGRLDVALNDSLLIPYLAQKTKLPVKAGARVGNVERAAVTFRKGDPAFKAAINQALADILGPPLTPEIVLR